MITLSLKNITIIALTTLCIQQVHASFTVTQSSSTPPSYGYTITQISRLNPHASPYYPLATRQAQHAQTTDHQKHKLSPHAPAYYSLCQAPYTKPTGNKAYDSQQK